MTLIRIDTDGHKFKREESYGNLDRVGGAAGRTGGEKLAAECMRTMLVHVLLLFLRTAALTTKFARATALVLVLFVRSSLSPYKR